MINADHGESGSMTVAHEPTQQLIAQGNESSTVIQALGSIYMRETLPEDDIPNSEQAALRTAWVEVDVVPILIKKLTERGLAVLGGPPGMGKRSAAIRALLEVSDERVASGRKKLTLKQLTPDWETPQSQVLPANANHGYLLDVTAEIDRWQKPLEIASAIAAHAATLHAKGSCLVLLTTATGWPSSTRAVAEAHVEVRTRASAHQIAVIHLEKIHQRPDRAAWLQPQHDETPAGQYAYLLTEGTTPEDAAHLAELLALSGDDQESVTSAIDAFQQWKQHLNLIFGREAKASVDERALLITAALVGDASALTIQALSRQLLNADTPDNVADLLAGPELTTLFESLGATTNGQTVSLNGKPGLGMATLQRVWRQRPDLHKHLLTWIAAITEPAAMGEAHLRHISQMIVALAIDNPDVELLKLAQLWVEPNEDGAGIDARRKLVASMLNQAAQAPSVGPVVREQLRMWAQGSSLPLAATVALVCQDTFAEHYPRQALVRLQWILKRFDRDEAVQLAEEAVQMMAAHPDLLVKDVWRAITKWVVNERTLAGRRAFLALMDPRPAYSQLAALLTFAATHPDIVVTFVDAWRETLTDSNVKDSAQTVLKAWGIGVAQATLPPTPTMDILHQVIQNHLTNGAVSALLYDATDVDTEVDLQALSNVRRQLWQRAHPAALTSDEAPSDMEP